MSQGHGQKRHRVSISHKTYQMTELGHINEQMRLIGNGAVIAALTYADSRVNEIIG